ncbi:MAG: PQQ-binding-like beta-propeller repeat protein [Vicinamibacterales bacterium]
MRRLIGILCCAAAVSLNASQEWSRFRGPNGSGIAVAGAVPLTFGPAEHVIWKTPLPFGHSSPILTDARIYLTALRDERLVTIARDRRNGNILWEREAPRARKEKLDTRNGPAAPSPAVDGQGVYVFFAEYGVVAYGHDGIERWRVPLGPFNNIYGMGASPIVVGDLVILVCDQSTGSYILALGTRDGRVRWKRPRPEAHSGHSTPILYKTAAGETQILVPGSFLLTAYATTGEKVWWVRGLSFEMKATPVVDGDTLFINGFGSPENQPGAQRTIPGYEEAVAAYDANQDARLLDAELPKAHSRAWIDLDSDGSVTREEWDYYRAAMASENGMLAIRLGGRGDVTSSHVVWKYHRSVPQLPSPLVYKDVLYMVNDGGIVTTLRPATGETIAQSRIKGVLDRFYASPVAADNKVFVASEKGKIAVLSTDGTLEPLAVNDLQDDIYATPAISGGRIYVRTRSMLYAFGQEQSPAPFEFKSGFWVNLHHYLHALARAGGPLVEPMPEAATTAEKDQWATGVQQYRERYGKRSLLFDEEMVKANVALGSVASESSLQGAAIAPEQRAILETVAPIYRKHLWKIHDDANRKFMSSVEPLLKQREKVIAERIARTFDTSWPSKPIRVELVHDAGPPGNAYTVSETATITVGADDPRHQGNAMLELLFHEASHVWDSVLMKDVSDAAKRLNVRAPRDLWHGLLFFNSGTIVSEALAAAGVSDYQMYMEKEGMFDRVYRGMREPMRTHWTAFLAGRISREIATERILRDLNLPAIK